MDMITNAVEELPPVYYPHYRHCLVKLRLLQLIQYDRVVYLDSDAIPLENLDNLFDIPITEDIAAPIAYWLPQLYATTLLIVAKPSLLAWNRAAKHFDSAYDMNRYDMDIVNVEFGHSMYYLPATFACLNSEWEAAGGPFYFGDPEKSFQNIKVVHFSALGKPWYYAPSEAKQLRPKAHPIFHWLWQRWWLERDQLIRDAPLLTKFRLLRLAQTGRRNPRREH
jgi:alpha-N-acetylglucosamine transferase